MRHSSGLRLLFFSPWRLSRQLGGPKVLVELGDELRDLGWTCDYVTGFDLRKDGRPGSPSNVARLLSDYLKVHAGDYDVVDYDHGYLPCPRDLFPMRVLFVARSVLLAHHFLEIPIPRPRGLGSALRSLAQRTLKPAQSTDPRRRDVRRAHRTLMEADIANVASERDRECLGRHGIPAEKIVVLPYGLSAARRRLFDEVDSTLPRPLRVAFVGTFDYRKGALDFPTIVAETLRTAPEAVFRLLGTKGLFESERQVLGHFAEALRPRIEVIPCFLEDQLPKLLADCSVGVFPSYIEGFPFGLVEMMAAGLPVVAYDVPGPSEILTPDYLVPRGRAAQLAAKIVTLLQDPNALPQARRWAREQSRRFAWGDIARRTDAIYREHVAARRVF